MAATVMAIASEDKTAQVMDGRRIPGQLKSKSEDATYFAER